METALTYGYLFVAACIFIYMFVTAWNLSDEAVDIILMGIIIPFIVAGLWPSLVIAGIPLYIVLWVISRPIRFFKGYRVLSWSI